jgi:anaerobic selenocysteine-containing dehydrogenase
VKGRDRATLQVHPDDAARLGLADGDRAQIESDTGAVTAAVELSDAVMPGVVSLPHGFGQSETRDTLRVAGALDAPNANVLNSVAALDPLSGTAALNSATVRVTRVSARDDAHGARHPGPA